MYWGSFLPILYKHSDYTYFTINLVVWIYDRSVPPCWLIWNILGIFMRITHISANSIINKMANRMRKWCYFLVFIVNLDRYHADIALNFLTSTIYQLLLPYVAFIRYRIVDFFRYVMFFTHSLELSILLCHIQFSLQ